MSARSVAVVSRISDLSIWLGLNAGAIVASLFLGVAGIWLGQYRQSLVDVGKLERYQAQINVLEEQGERAQGAYLALWDRNGALDAVNYDLRMELQALRERALKGGAQ